MPFLLVIILMLTSCIGNSRTKMHESNEEVADGKLTQIINSIENEDEELIKALFSNRALEESKDFSKNAKLLFEFFEGEIVKWEKSSGPTVYKSVDNGDVVKEVDSYYFVETDEATYYFLINDFPIDDINSDNVGLNMLLVVLAENRLDIYDQDKEILFKDGEKISPAYIYL